MRALPFHPVTLKSGLAAARPGVLVAGGTVLAFMLLAGCSTGAYRFPPPPHAASHHPAIVTSDNQAVRSAAQEELGPDVAAEIPITKQPPPQAVDPRAKAMVDSMLERMSDRAMSDGGLTRIGLSQVRNQSRIGAREFSEFCTRFADLLTDAGREAHLEFTSDSQAEVHYHLQGAAYLASFEGFDVWELYLSLSTAAQPWELWRAPGPVRVLRHPRPGQPQVLSP